MGGKNIEKLERVGHVQKRIGTSLRKLKQTTKAGDVGDKKRLTDREVDKMRSFLFLLLILFS